MAKKQTPKKRMRHTRRVFDEAHVAVKKEFHLLWKVLRLPT